MTRIFHNIPKEVISTTESEKELLKLIRESEDPEQALLVAVETICAFLDRAGIPRDRPPASLPSH